MKSNKTILAMFALCLSYAGSAQIDKDKLALEISQADEANSKIMKTFIWKRKSDVSVDGQVKLTTITEFSFADNGKLQAKLVDAESDVKQKRGLRGRAQKNAAEDKMEYVGKALELALAYSFMTKGQLVDFFSKAQVTEKDGIIEATATDVYVKGDKLTIQVDPKTKLYTSKRFSSFLGKDAVDGEMKFEKMSSSGLNHGTTTVLNMPAQKMKIDAVNQDYSQKVK